MHHILRLDLNKRRFLTTDPYKTDTYIVSENDCREQFKYFESLHSACFAIDTSMNELSFRVLTGYQRERLLTRVNKSENVALDQWNNEVGMVAI